LRQLRSAESGETFTSSNSCALNLSISFSDQGTAEQLSSIGANLLRRRSELTALIAPNDFESQEDRARNKQNNAHGGEPA
jgi:hypothetical protein